jgi:P4 family phage/plasmid primase-like protien
MNQLAGGDEETVLFLLKYLGIAMSNIAGYRFKKSLFLIGPGNTGKSQLKALLEHILGDENHFAIDLSGIESRFGTSYIYGKRMVGSADMGFLSLDELRTFKQLTGGDSIMAERKGQQAFSFKYNGILMFCANQTPRFRGDDGEWVYDRFCIINCNNVVPEGKRDSKLLSKMYAECEGIIYKAIMALRDVIDNDYILREPQSVIDARKVYQRDNNIVSAFFDECMEPIGNTPKNNCCTVTHIYKVFCKWCSVNNSGRTISKLDFERDLAQYLGVEETNLTERATQGMIVRGYTLNNDGLIYYNY